MDMVGTDRDEMAFFYLDRKATDLFTLTENGLKSQLDKDFGGNTEKILANVSEELWRRQEVEMADKLGPTLTTTAKNLSTLFLSVALIISCHFLNKRRCC
jgi:hypothetical protein